MRVDKLAAMAALSAIAASAALIAGPASAQAPHPPLYVTSIQATYFDTQLGKQDYIKSTPNYTFNETDAFAVGRTNWSVSAATKAGHGGTVQADILAESPFTSGGSAQDLFAQATATYYFTVNGGTAGDTVGVFIDAKGTISWSQGGIASAGFSLNDYTHYSGFIVQNNINYNDVPANELKGTEMFQDTQELLLTSGDTYAVSLNADVIYHSNEYLGAPDAQGAWPYSEDHSVVDPTFTIDTAKYKGFTLDADGGPLASASPAVAGVPEPATWAMMMAGLAGMGATLRNRRKALSPA